MTYKRKVQIGDCTLYLGDCLEVMPTLDKVNHIISDPPYEKEAHRPDRRVQNKNGLIAGALSFEKITDDIRENVCFLASDIINGWFIAFCQAEGVAPWRDCIEAANMKYKRPMIWIKPDGMPQFNGQCAGMGYESMVSAWAGKGRSYWNGGGRHGVFTFPKDEGVKPVHETQKPIKLMLELTQLFTNEQETILDPFMGSGTTGVACAKLGRKFIGIELDEDYFNIACERIKKAYEQPDLFIETPSKIEQITMEGIE
jgi:DNA modification methylase